jgi:hypothetical protein
MFGTPNTKLKKCIISRLKTFSEIKKQYNIGDDIYRSGERKYFSKKCNLEGCPISRPTNRLDPNDSYENTEKDETILEPIWYSTDLLASQRYCRGKPDCSTYRYTPLDYSLIKNDKLVFLDLTDFDNVVIKIDDKNVYNLFTPLMTQLYDHIIRKYEKQFIKSDSDNEIFMCVDNPCKNSFTLETVYSAYGYYYGLRSSEMYIDRFFTLELFQIIKDLNIENEQTCKVLGYYHADVLHGYIDNRIAYIDEGYFPSEFTIKYGYSVIKHYINFKGEIKKGGAKNKTKIKNNKKTRKIKNDYK